MEHLNDRIKIKFGLAISQLVDVVGVRVIMYSFHAGYAERLVHASAVPGHRDNG